MQLKTFVKDLAFVQVVNFLVKPLWILAVDRVVQNQLGQELYGQYYAAFNLAVMFIILADLGLNNYLTKDAVDDAKSSRSIIKNSIGIKLTLSLIYFLLILFIGWQKDVPMGLLFWVGANLILLSISQWLRVWFNVTKAFRRESLIAVSDRLIAILLWLGIFSVFTLKDQQLLKLFLGAQTVGFIVAIGIALFFIYREDSHLAHEKTTSMFKVILSCLPYTLLAFFMAAFTRIDVELMDYLISSPVNYHKGVYAQGFVILNAGNMMAALFGTMLLPIFTKQIKQKETVLPIMKTSTLILGSSGLLVLVVLQIWGKEIFEVYYQTNAMVDSDFQYHLNTFCTVILVYIPMALTYVFGTYLTALGKLKILVALAILTFALNVILNMFLQPCLQAYGAAISALVTQSFFCLVCIFLSVFFIRRGKQEALLLSDNRDY